MPHIATSYIKNRIHIVSGFAINNGRGAKAMSNAKHSKGRLPVLQERNFRRRSGSAEEPLLDAAANSSAAVIGIPMECCLLDLGKGVKPVNLGTRKSFADIAATVTELLGVDYETEGQSFAKEILKK